ncbi:MAG: alcohol dehydrogenase catalytic domain-containing protein [Candidatus Promineifilaceae bacterium]
MKALVLEGNGRLVYRGVATPPVASDECLLAVAAAGVCSSDIPRAFAGGAYAYPLIMGHEFAGRVVACGPDVEDFRPGDAAAVFPLLPCRDCPACRQERWAQCRAYDYYGSRRDGAFSEFVAVKAWNMRPLPAGCDLGLAALCEPLAVCAHTLNTVPAVAGGRLAIVGAGFMGLSLGLMVRDLGRFDEIWLLDRNTFKLELAAGLGLQTYNLADRAGAADLAAAFDVVIEACGAVETYRLALALAAAGGQLLLLGNISGKLALSQQEASSVLRRELTLRGVWNSVYRPGQPDDWDAALSVVSRAGWLAELVSHRPRLSEGAAVFEALHAIKQAHRPHDYLKACFQF